MLRTAGKTTRPRSKSGTPTSTAKTTPLLAPEDVKVILREMAVQLAPADVEEVMSQEDSIRKRAAGLPADGFPLLAAQLDVACDCLRDHLDGVSPQIPYYAVALLAAGVIYFVDEVDAVPDFLPRIGKLDDAAVMAMACELAADGLRRYCDFKGRPMPVAPAVAAPARRRTRG